MFAYLGIVANVSTKSVTSCYIVLPGLSFTSSVKVTENDGKQTQVALKTNVTIKHTVDQSHINGKIAKVEIKQNVSGLNIMYCMYLDLSKPNTGHLNQTTSKSVKSDLRLRTVYSSTKQPKNAHKTYQELTFWLHIFLRFYRTNYSFKWSILL